MSDAAIRPVRAADAAAIAAIYRPYVLDTAITFELDPPDAIEIARRIALYTAAHPWLVAARSDGGLAGYAYAAPFHARAGYARTVETSIYLAADARGEGLGVRLYDTLLADLETRGCVAAIGVMTVPNAASEALHRRCGFRDAGRLAAIGFKLGRWHDIGYWQRDLAVR